MTENSGRSWQKALRRMPRWLIVLVIATAWAALQVGMRFLMGKEIEAGYVAVTGPLGVALGIFALWFTGRIQAKERKLPPGSPTCFFTVVGCQRVCDGAMPRRNTRQRRQRRPPARRRRAVAPPPQPIYRTGPGRNGCSRWEGARWRQVRWASTGCRESTAVVH
ncbi:MAG: hypothetical protein JWM13_1537, partial [Arthrobacter sp.]|nr:hypothetical protein [Arthrobacter sp.]